MILYLYVLPVIFNLILLHYGIYHDYSNGYSTSRLQYIKYILAAILPLINLFYLMINMISLIVFVGELEYSKRFSKWIKEPLIKRNIE